MRGINFLSIIAFIYILVSCAGGEKSGDVSKDASLAFDKDDGKLEEGLKEKPAKPTEEELETKYVGLSRALKLNDEREIEKRASEILRKNPNDIKVLNALAVFYYGKKMYGLSKQILLRAVKAGSDSAAIHNNLGLVLLAEDETEAAVSEFKRSLSIDSGNVSAAANLGTLYAKYGSFSRALPLLRIAYSARPKDINIAKGYAVALRSQKKNEAAAEIYEKLASGSQDFGLLLDYADILINDLNDKNQGRKILNKVRFLDPRGQNVDRVIELERKLQ